MALKNIKKDNGFTIVELLIVIVVIAILATISIVAYTGIQNRAKTSAGQQLAAQIAKKMEAYYAINSAYPTTRTQIQGTPESKIDGLPASNTASATKPIILPASDTLFNGTGTPAVATALTAATADGGQAVRIWGTASSGDVYYWDYTKTASNETAIHYGP